MGTSMLNLSLARYRLGLLDETGLVRFLQMDPSVNDVKSHYYSLTRLFCGDAESTQHIKADIADFERELDIVPGWLLPPAEMYFRCCLSPSLDPDESHGANSTHTSERLDILRKDLTASAFPQTESDRLYADMEIVLPLIDDYHGLTEYLLHREFDGVFEKAVGKEVERFSVFYTGELLKGPIRDYWCDREYPGIEIPDGSLGYFAVTLRGENGMRDRLAIFNVTESYWPEVNSISCSDAVESCLNTRVEVFDELVGHTLRSIAVFGDEGAPSKLEFRFGEATAVIGLGYQGCLRKGGCLHGGVTDPTPCEPILRFPRN